MPLALLLLLLLLLPINSVYGSYKCKSVGYGFDLLLFQYQPLTVYRDLESGDSNLLPFVIQTLHQISMYDEVSDQTSSAVYNYYGGHYFYNYAAIPRSVLIRDYLSNDAGQLETYQYFDGLGRKLQIRKGSKVMNHYIVAALAYDKRNRVSKEWLHYYNSCSAFEPTT